MQGAVLLIEAACMTPALVIALFQQDGDAWALGATMLILIAIGAPLRFLVRPGERNLRAREGFLTVALAWIALSCFGALPFVFSGMIPNYIDALFESVSGFMTTGATVLENFDNLPQGIMFWRSFTHWIGGMGVLVLTLALVPQLSERTSHLVKAESPGPTLSKIVPKMGDTAKIFYIIYLILTILEFIVLMIAGMNPYDAAIHAMGTAGTGGFSNYAASVGAFASPVIDIAITVFMVMFGINFALYYCAITGNWRGIVKSEELRWYLGIFLTVTAAITVVILPQYGTVGNALRYASFQVASIMSTTGYATADFSLWPVAARMLIFMLMFIGACAGSTGGGIKCSRILLLGKSVKKELMCLIHPRLVRVNKMDGQRVPHEVMRSINVFVVAYAFIFILSLLIISLNCEDLVTCFTSVATTLNNVGPGLSLCGPTCNFGFFPPLSKGVLIFDMLAGRLELFPMLLLFTPGTWQRNK